MKNTVRKNWIPTFTGMMIAIIFSFFLMFHTFSYDSHHHQIQISSKLWSDFGAHIPLIRSFSEGPNLIRLLHVQPVESPLFPGEPIRYHFGFYALVGMFEKLGVRIDWALNTLSAIGLSGLLIFIYYFSYELFKRQSVSILSIVFFLCNGSLSFLSFFKEHPLSSKSLFDIITNSKFPAFGPWDNGLVTAFWTLNIYTNQRHLGLSYALLVGILFLLYVPTKNLRRHAILVAFMTAFLLCINFAVAGIAAIVLTWIFLSQKHLRIHLLPTIGLGLIAFLWLYRVSNASSIITWQPGYLVPGMLTLPKFIQFWGMNLGLHMLFIPLGIILAPKPIRKFLAPPLILLFIIPNVYRFSPDMINNHKFFNFFLILGNMFSAFALIQIITWCTSISKTYIRIPLVSMITSVCLISFTLSGVIDFFPVINDVKGNVPDIVANPDSEFFKIYTRPTDRIANSTWFYHPASIAGRSLFSGYTYFTWSYGYNQSEREAALISIYSAPTIQKACERLLQNDISWVELNVTPETYLSPHWELWKGLPFAYQNPKTKLTIYNTDQICKDISL